MRNDLIHHLHVTIRADRVSAFFPLLQRGFKVKAPMGSTVKSVLCDQLGLTQEYLDEKVQTIFLDGKAIDDLDTSIITETSTLALSAAMPGLVGATLRRGGYYAAMRSQITHHETEHPVQEGEGLFTLKIFNLLTGELGPPLLERGIWVKSKEFQDFLQGQSQDFRAVCLKAQLDGVTIGCEALQQALPEEGEWVHLMVTLEEQPA